MEVSNKGRLRGVSRRVTTINGWSFVKQGRYIPGSTNVHGYTQINMPVAYSGKRRCVRLLHRLIAEAFIPNPDGKPHVNHINGVKTDNQVGNLEWCTHRENMRHARAIGLIDDRQPVIAVRGAVVEWFPSIQSTRRYGFSPGLVCESISGKRQRTHKGRVWRKAELAS